MAAFDTYSTHSTYDPTPPSREVVVVRVVVQGSGSNFPDPRLQETERQLRDLAKKFEAAKAFASFLGRFRCGPQPVRPTRQYPQLRLRREPEQPRAPPLVSPGRPGRKGLIRRSIEDKLAPNLS